MAVVTALSVAHSQGFCALTALICGSVGRQQHWQRHAVWLLQQQRHAPVIELRRQRVPEPLEQVHEAVKVLRPAQHQCLQPLQRDDALLPVHRRPQASAHLHQMPAHAQ